MATGVRSRVLGVGSSDGLEETTEEVGVWGAGAEAVIVKTDPGTPCDGLFCIQPRSTAYLSMITDFHKVENGETGDVETLLQKLCNLRECCER